MSRHKILSDLLTVNLRVPDPGDGEPIAVTRNFSQIGISVGAGAETNTLPDPPRAGIELTLVCVQDAGGSRVITAATAINAAGNTVMTFADVRDHIKLVSIEEPGGDGDTFVWNVLANPGDAVALS